MVVECLGSSQVRALQLRTSCGTLHPQPGGARLARNIGQAPPLFFEGLVSLSAQVPERSRELIEKFAALSDVYSSNVFYIQLSPTYP